MVADSPYSHHDLALPARAGMVAGAVSSVVVVGALGMLQGAGHVSLARLVVFVLLGSLFGLLYASSQMRAPWRGLLTVAVFYGFLLWLLSGPLLGRFLPRDLAAIVHSGRWLLGCVAYGLSLALVTGVHQLTRPQPIAQVKD